MLYRVIDKTELPRVIEAFMASYEVIAPVQTEDGVQFNTISSADQVVLSYDSTMTSLKKFFLPNDEPLFSFSVRSNDVTEFSFKPTPRVIFGAHPCDINALNRMDIVFKNNRYPDPYYIARRDSTLIVGISCMPQENCFCHLFGADSARFGYDLFLQDLGDRYFVSLSSVECANILEASCDLRVATDEDRIAFRRATRTRQEAFNPEIPKVQEVAMLMDAFHSDPFWEDFGNKCLACNACASVCPTCFCFDIVDKLDPDGQTGTRLRQWDACTSPQFALVAGGHNFRDDGRDRVRHRMYHKLNGFLAVHNRMLCVGCGRCVPACKVNINPIEVLKFFERKGASAEMQAEMADQGILFEEGKDGNNE